MNEIELSDGRKATAFAESCDYYEDGRRVTIPRCGKCKERKALASNDQKKYWVCPKECKSER